MKRRAKKAQERAKRKMAREAGQRRPGGQSAYARKHEYLTTHGVFGFDIPEPKPWR